MQLRGGQFQAGKLWLGLSLPSTGQYRWNSTLPTMLPIALFFCVILRKGRKQFCSKLTVELFSRLKRGEKLTVTT